MNVEQILKLAEIGFTAEQITKIMDTSSESSQAQPEQMVERSKPENHIPSEHDAPENIVGKIPEVIKEVEQPQIDYAKLAEEIALRQQKQSTFNPESPKVEAPPAQKSAEEITLGLLNKI